MILDSVLESHKAEDIAKNSGLSSEEEGAELWFNRIHCDCTWRMDGLPEYNQFVKKIEAGNLYYDCDNKCYFLVDANVMYGEYIMIDTESYNSYKHACIEVIKNKMLVINES